MQERLLGIHEYDENKRPIGRFLLSRSAEFRQQSRHEAAFQYAEDFAMKWDGILRKNGSSTIAVVEMDDGGGVSVPTRTPTYERAIYLEFDQSFAENGSYIWRLRSGREQYDLILNREFCLLTKIDYSNQFDVLRRYSIDGDETKYGIQSLVENILSYPQVLGKLVREQHNKQQVISEYIALLEKQQTDSLGKNETKRLHQLKREVTRPRLDDGSVDRRGKKPLLGKHDWRPVPMDENDGKQVAL